ncbi:hypothetical protein [Bacillus horti]|uniref:Uncharacterized protein n=1 Tax=Caldalkalibacillus horti TaxID=77523 RepID=A0ABT9W1K8_9BACI|nr:hypothetical protein [Bacillus horti]MDQ0167127.1 hypothetical protein [Bacillus horti]
MFSNNSYASTVDSISSQYNLTAGKVDLSLLDPELQLMLSERYKEVDDYFLLIEEKEMMYDEILSTLSTNKLNMEENHMLYIEASTLKSEILDLKNNMEENIGLIEIEHFGDIGSNEDLSIASVSSDVDITVNLYYDQTTGQYVLSGGWEWKNRNWFSDCGWGACGGYNGFALQILNRDIAIFDETLYTYSGLREQFVRTNTMEKEYSSYGLGMRFQDNQIVRNWEYEYDSHRGQGRIWFEFSDGTPTGTIVSYKAGYAHTWNSTEVSSITISATGISFSFSTTENRWSDERNGNFRF